jgi:hypothetical protein
MKPAMAALSRKDVASLTQWAGECIRLGRTSFRCMSFTFHMMAGIWGILWCPYIVWKARMKLFFQCPLFKFWTSNFLKNYNILFSELLATELQVPVSIPGATRFSWLAVVLDRGPLCPCEDKCGATWKKISGSDPETEINNGRRSAALTTRHSSIHTSWH